MWGMVILTMATVSPTVAEWGSKGNLLSHSRTRLSDDTSHLVIDKKDGELQAVAEWGSKGNLLSHSRTRLSDDTSHLVIDKKDGELQAGLRPYSTCVHSIMTFSDTKHSLPPWEIQVEDEEIKTQTS
ncbi:hypothetical protein TREES_T100006223 [Tupaia chinensis]|uniref:Uncharacterized protein n=1 Tax=Tupaia chinensis TaxID=246437 RepID=L9L959_TUPCH|nr:hypothetical protein TREES_T100006223 [Tupaia chinensis]